MRDTNYLVHFGVKGQKWGLRQWQYKDGSYTSAGRIHYGIGNGNRVKKEVKKSETDKNTKKKSNTGKKLLVGLGVAAVAGYGVYKMSKLYADEKDKLEATQKTKAILKGIEKVSIIDMEKQSDWAINEAKKVINSTKNMSNYVNSNKANTVDAVVNKFNEISKTAKSVAKDNDISPLNSNLTNKKAAELGAQLRNLEIIERLQKQKYEINNRIAEDTIKKGKALLSDEELLKKTQDLLNESYKFIGF